MGNKNRKDAQLSLDIREMQTKNTMKCNFIPTTLVNIFKTAKM